MTQRRCFKVLPLHRCPNFWPRTNTFWGHDYWIRWGSPTERPAFYLLLPAKALTGPLHCLLLRDVEAMRSHQKEFCEAQLATHDSGCFLHLHRFLRCSPGSCARESINDLPVVLIHLGRGEARAVHADAGIRDKVSIEIANAHRSQRRAAAYHFPFEDHICGTPSLCLECTQPPFCFYFLACLSSTVFAKASDAAQALATGYWRYRVAHKVMICLHLPECAILATWMYICLISFHKTCPNVIHDLDHDWTCL